MSENLHLIISRRFYQKRLTNDENNRSQQSKWPQSSTVATHSNGFFYVFIGTGKVNRFCAKFLQIYRFSSQDVVFFNHTHQTLITKTGKECLRKKQMQRSVSASADTARAARGGASASEWGI